MDARAATFDPRDALAEAIQATTPVNTGAGEVNRLAVIRPRAGTPSAIPSPARRAGRPHRGQTNSGRLDG